jgi:hypothetical protein
MKRALLAGIALAFAALAPFGPSDAVAGDPGAKREARKVSGEFRPTGGYYGYGKRKRPQVRGYVSRRGGYSYYGADSINTYGDSRSLYGGTMMFRDWRFDRQSISGPFDHGFFFDSGVRPRGGDSPYMN